jgi:hypothetical protein
MDHKEKTSLVITKATQEYYTVLPNQTTVMPTITMLIGLKKLKNLLEL